MKRDGELAVPGVPDDVEIVAGPQRVGSELRWHARVAGVDMVLAQLAAELASDRTVRARWVDDTLRMIALDVPGHARPTRMGPDPDPADPSAPPPWRLRPQPPGEPLDRWLAAHAPLDPVSGLAVMRRIAEAVEGVHARGAVIRDLQPRNIVLASDAATLVDIGLSRTDTLSSRTAASLLLEDSPYTAPECLRRTSVDRRADIYSLGVLAHVILVGVPPWGDCGAVTRPSGSPPAPSTLRPGIDAALDAGVLAALAEEPERRPGSVSDFIAWFAPGAGAVRTREVVRCQHCGAEVRVEQRLCVACGRRAVRFEHEDGPESVNLVLTKAVEDAEFARSLRDTLAPIAAGPLPDLDFLIGDVRMYSRGEQKRRIRLPAQLFVGLSRETAASLVELFSKAGLKTRVARRRPPGRKLAIVAGAMAAIGVASAVILGLAGVTAGIPVVGIFTALAVVFFVMSRRAPKTAVPLMRLRDAPAALPASDPLVARLAAHLHPQTAHDVRQRVGELALALQRLVDHRLEHHRERAEIDLVTAPVERLVDALAREVERIADFDTELRGLEEGELVRALARSEARAEPEAARDAIRSRLARLRVLEEQRAAAFGRLLDVSGLLERAVALGVGVRDEQVEYDRVVAAARQALEAG